jgi:hypothetical protein
MLYAYSTILITLLSDLGFAQCMYTHNETLSGKPIDLKMSSRQVLQTLPRFQDATYFLSTKTAFFQF